ncbi:MAG: hypothetical protein Q9160_007459 [Pyrenula sp. 1 TL-2023]
MEETKDGHHVRPDGKDDKAQASEADKVASEDKKPTSTSHSNAKNAPQPGADDDSDPDLEDLDDILDEFSPSSSAATAAAKPQSKPNPSSSGPGRPPPQTTPSEADFLANLQSEMSSLLSSGKLPIANSDTNGKPDPTAEAAEIANMGKELDDFTRQMERDGVKPEDLLKSILGEEAGSSSEPKLDKGIPAKEKPVSDSFEETIKKTMDRLKTSDSSATSAAQQSSSAEEDMLAALMKAMEQNPDGGGEGEGDLSKILADMMEQLTNKDMLYEPMKELDSKFDSWLQTNEKKISQEDLERYRTQRRIVREIVGKFEEPGYSDEKADCRSFIWEKMQIMQAAGSPPEELISNPWPGLMGEGGDNPLGGCPTQ